MVIFSSQLQSYFYYYPFFLTQRYPVLRNEQILSFQKMLPNFFCSSSLLNLTQDNSFFSSQSFREFNTMGQQDKKRKFQQNNSSTNDCLILEKNSQKGKQNIIQSINNEVIKPKYPRYAFDQQKKNKKVEKKRKGKKKNIKKLTLKQKRQKQLKRNQTQNSKRNIIPNQIHQMFSILFKKKKSARMVQNLIKKYSLQNSKFSFSTKRFYIYQSLLKQRINHYVNQQSLKLLFNHLEPSYQIYPKEEQNLYLKIGLILVRHFLQNQATLIILNSQRIKLQNKLAHLSTKRYLLSLLSQMIKKTF